MKEQTDVKGLAKDSNYGASLSVDSNSDIDEVARNNRRTLIRAYEAQLAGDFDTWWSIFDKDVAFYEAESLPYGCSVKGLANAIAGMDGMFDAWSNVHVEFEQFLAAGDIVIAYVHMRAVSRRTGEIYEGPVAELFRFRSGKIIEWRPIYWDTHKVREVYGDC